MFKERTSTSVSISPEVIPDATIKRNATTVLPSKFTQEAVTASEPNMLLKADTCTITTSINNLRYKLTEFAVGSHVSHSCFNKLLSILKKPRTTQEFFDLPSDCRTILKTTMKPNA